MAWIRRHPRFDINPGMPAGQERDGISYSWAIAAKALPMAGITTLDHGGRAIDWRGAITAQLAGAVRTTGADAGSWANSAKRWGEGLPQLPRSTRCRPSSASTLPLIVKGASESTIHRPDVVGMGHRHHEMTA